MTDYHDLYRKSLTTAGNAFGPKDPDKLAAQILTRTDLSRDDLAHILTRALLALVTPDRVANLDDLRDELVEAMNDVAHENCGEDGAPCPNEDYGKYVDDVLMPVLREHAAKVEVAS